MSIQADTAKAIRKELKETFGGTQINLSNKITQGDWTFGDKTDKFDYIVRAGDKILVYTPSSKEIDRVNAKAIAQVPNMLKVIECLAQELEAKALMEGEDSFGPLDSGLLQGCREIVKELR